MASYFEGQLRAERLRFDIVISRFNEFYGEKLLAGCLDCLERHGADAASIRVFRVPGSFEIPQMVRHLARKGDADAIIALGVLIRGETPHFDYIASDVIRGVSSAAAESGKPVTFGVLTCDNAEQAAERSGSKSGNKGWEAALAAIEMADLFRSPGPADRKKNRKG